MVTKALSNLFCDCNTVFRSVDVFLHSATQIITVGIMFVIPACVFIITTYFVNLC